MYDLPLFTATRIYIYVTASFLTGKTWQQPHRCYVTFIACHMIYMADVVPIIHERQIITSDCPINSQTIFMTDLCTFSHLQHAHQNQCI